MSYSFSARVATKDEARAKVASELEQYLHHQPQHRERDQVQTIANAFIDLLADDDTQDIQIQIHGSVGWKYGAEAPEPLNAISVGVSIHHVPKL